MVILRSWIYALWAFLFVGLGLGSRPAAAQGSFVDVSLNGSYGKDYGTYKLTTKISYGLELDFPLTGFFEVTVGHTIYQQTDTYNQTYKDAMVAQGVKVPEGALEQVQSQSLTYVNGALGYPIGALKPSAFGGVLWKKVCSEDTWTDYGCTEEAMTWNAGVSLSVYVTWKLRLKATHRISPSVLPKTEARRYDQYTSFGLAWSL